MGPMTTVGERVAAARTASLARATPFVMSVSSVMTASLVRWASQVMTASLVLMAASVMTASGCSTSPGPAQQANQAQSVERIAYPPSVLNGRAELYCSISSTANGQQRLVMHDGAGIEFDAAVSPIVDGVVETQGPTKGGRYSFTSHLVAPVSAKIAGIGNVKLIELETRVTVGLKGYAQEKPGKPLTFKVDQLLTGGSYVEFTGKAESTHVLSPSTVYAFRVNFGEATFAEGKVEPDGPNDRAPIASKMVIFHSPIVTSVLAQSATTVQQLP